MIFSLTPTCPSPDSMSTKVATKAHVALKSQEVEPLCIRYAHMSVVTFVNIVSFTISLAIRKYVNDKLSHMAAKILANIVSGNGLLSDGTNPLPESLLTYHQ